MKRTLALLLALLFLLLTSCGYEPPEHIEPPDPLSSFTGEPGAGRNADLPVEGEEDRTVPALRAEELPCEKMQT